MNPSTTKSFIDRKKFLVKLPSKELNRCLRQSRRADIVNTTKPCRLLYIYLLNEYQVVLCLFLCFAIGELESIFENHHDSPGASFRERTIRDIAPPSHTFTFNLIVCSLVDIPLLLQDTDTRLILQRDYDTLRLPLTLHCSYSLMAQFILPCTLMIIPPFQ